MKSLERFLDEAADLVWAKKTEKLINLIITVIGTSLTLLMAAWLIHQIKVMWGV